MNRIPEERYRRLGDTPWNLEGLGAAFEYAALLHETPRDDWDRKQRGVDWREDYGSTLGATFNPDMIENQIGTWVSAKLREQGLDLETRRCHMWRLFEVMDFLRHHELKLKEAGLIHQSSTNPDERGLSEALLQVLATARYEGVRLQGPDPVPTFHYARVVEAALSLAAEDPL